MRTVAFLIADVAFVSSAQAGLINFQWDGGSSAVSGSFDMDSPEDPTVRISNSVSNDTGFAWTGYQVNVSTNQPFTISSPAATTPGDWSAVVTQQAAWDGAEYLGVVNLTAGTPVGIGASLDFTYTISFAGSGHYGIDQEMIPAPEPATLSLLAAGDLGVMVRRRNRRSSKTRSGTVSDRSFSPVVGRIGRGRAKEAQPWLNDS